MSADAITNTIANNKARMEKLEDQKEQYDTAISAAKEQKHSIWVQMRSFLNRCGTSNVNHLTFAQKAEYLRLRGMRDAAQTDYRYNQSRYLSVNGSLFDLVLDTGKLEMSQMVLDNVASA